MSPLDGAGVRRSAYPGFGRPFGAPSPGATIKGPFGTQGRLHSVTRGYDPRSLRDSRPLALRHPLLTRGLKSKVPSGLARQTGARSFRGVRVGDQTFLRDWLKRGLPRSQESAASSSLHYSHRNRVPFHSRVMYAETQ